MPDWTMGDPDAYRAEWAKIRRDNERQKRKAAKRRAYRARKRTRIVEANRA